MQACFNDQSELPCLLSSKIIDSSSQCGELTFIGHWSFVSYKSMLMLHYLRVFFKSVVSIAATELIVTQLNVNIAFGAAFSYSKLSILNLSWCKSINKLSDKEYDKYDCMSYERGPEQRIVLYCGRVPATNAPGCIAAEGLLYKSWSLVFPTCTARCLHQRPQQ